MRKGRKVRCMEECKIIKAMLLYRQLPEYVYGVTATQAVSGRLYRETVPPNSSLEGGKERNLSVPLSSHVSYGSRISWEK